MGTRTVVAVVPFAAAGTEAHEGAIARQLARRLVERLPDDDAIEVRPVFLVTVPEGREAAGHLIFGSAPPPDLAAQYGASLGATHTLVGTLRRSGGDRALDVTLVDVRRRAVLARRTFVAAAGRLPHLEHDLGEWLAETTGARGRRADLRPAFANEEAYVALLEAMEHEVNATLLERGDRARAGDERAEALERYLAAVRADADAGAAEERLLVLAAGALERREATAELRALEELIMHRPRSWRAHYVLGRVRAEAGDPNGAIVAFEHARSLHALPDEDLVRLAELYANAAAPAPAQGHLRRIAATSPAYGAAQELLAIIGFQRGDLEAAREAFARAEAAGAASWELHASYGAALHARGELAEAAARYEAAIAAGGPGAVRLNLARVRLGAGDRERALRDLEALLADEHAGEVAGQARRLRFGLREPDLERELERAGRLALDGDARGLEEAHDAFTRALAVEPDLWEARFGLGLVARQRGDAAAALAAFRRVLELWPDQPDALHELGVALLSSDERAAAPRVLDHAAALRPGDPAYLADAGLAHLRAGNLVTARQRLERASRLDPNDPVTRAYLAELDHAEAARRGERT